MKHQIASRMKRLALEVICLVEHLPPNGPGDVIGKQLVRSVTSVGANYRAACRARSRADLSRRFQLQKKSQMKLSTGWSC